MMQGYLRADGRKGIRNTIVVGYLVECAHHVAREIALPFRDSGVHVIGFPGCYPNSYAEQMMAAALHAPQCRGGAAGLARLRELQQISPRADGPRKRPAGEDHRHPGDRRDAQVDCRGQCLHRRAARRRSMPWKPCRWRSTSWSSARSAAARTAPPASPAIRRRAAPSTCSSTTAPPASSRRPAS